MALTATVTPGKTFVGTELVTNSKLNQAAAPTVDITGTADASDITDDAVTAAKAAFGAWFYCGASTTSNVITLTASGHTITLAAGMIARFIADTTTTGAVNITFGGSTKDLFRNFNVELAGGDLKAGQAVEIFYDGTQWQLLSVEANRQVVIGTDAGSTDAYVITPTPAVRALADLTGVPVVFKSNTINTGNATLNVNALGAVNILKSYNGTLSDGDIKAGQWVTVVYDGASFQLQSAVTQPTARTTVPVRQTVLSCSVGSTGLPNYVAVSGQNISFQNCDTTNLVIAFAAGYDSSGAVDYVGVVSANTSNVWTISVTNATYYLFAERNTSTGAISYGSVATLAPAYTNSSTISTATDQHTFSINTMKMSVGIAGPSSSIVQRVFLGECVVSGSVLQTPTLYMPRGEFVSSVDIDTTLTNSIKTDTHQLGLVPRTLRCVLVAQTTPSTHGYAIGDEIDANAGGGSGVNVQLAANATTLSNRAVWLTYAPNLNNATPANAALIAADWKWRFYAGRGW